MSVLPPDVRFDNGQSVPNHFNAMANYMSYQAQRYRDNVQIRYYSSNNNKKMYKTLTYGESDHIATNLACRLFEYTKGHQTVAFIANHNASYLIFMLAFLKLRITTLCISPNNPVISVVNLLSKTKCSLVLTFEKFLSLANTSAEQIPGTQVIKMIEMDFEALTKEPLDTRTKEVIDTEFSDQDLQKPALILHSSGSTGLPKPVYLSNRYMFNVVKTLSPLINARENFSPITENDTTLSCFPLLHIAGIYCVFTLLSAGGSIAFLNTLPSSLQDITFALAYNKCTVIHSPPIIVDNLIEHVKRTNDFSCISNLRYIQYGGAPLSSESGEWIHKHGIVGASIYGSSEAGILQGSNLDGTNKSGNSLVSTVIDENGDSYCVFEIVDKSEPDIRHLYVRPGCPTFANDISNRPDGGYDTNDLFKEDTKNPGSFIYYGRKDDTLVMYSGEKTNPLLMETDIRKSSIIKQAIVVGRGRQCTGCLINLNDEYSRSLPPDEIVSAVYDAVTRANKKCPKHSFILPQMIKILPQSTLIPVTDKGTLMRKRAEIELKDVIDDMYNGLFKESTTAQGNNKGGTVRKSKL